jgi:sugar lactone lactonase YvrE
MRHNQYVIHYRRILLLVCAPVFGQQYTISTLAGNGAAGTFLNYPTSVAVDEGGDIYVADWSGFIRKIWVRDSAVTTVAGTGVLGYSGDGGQATNATIGKAIAIALDAAGNIYIADGDNNRIRRVDASTRIITTVAGTGAAVDSGDGGPGINAGVSRPTGITVDAGGNLYFSSSWSRVRKLAAKSGTIETVAGQSTTSFGGDNGLAIDAFFWDPIPSVVNRDGDIYIADYENSRIRVVRARTGIVTTVAGSSLCTSSVTPINVAVCQGAFGGDGGPAINAILNHAEAVASDAEGNLYIADTINHRIRRVDASTGLIHTIAGSGVNGFSGDGGPAIAAEISFPVGIAIDRSGKVYFTDENNNRVRVLIPTLRPSLLAFNGSMSDLAGLLSNSPPYGVRERVVDQTGIAGLFSFALNMKDFDANDPAFGGNYEEMESAAFAFISNALGKQYGLKLEHHKVALDSLVVDSGNKTPTEN